jgi:hypothetical protein
MAATLAAAALMIGTTLQAQKTTQVHPGKAGSPHVKSEWTIDGANISIEYGRPMLKGRTPGKDVDPYEGREWRTGADEATTLVTNRALKFGNLSVPAGTYTLYTIPAGGTWQLIVSKRTGQWGIPYPKGDDLGRAAMTLTKAPKAADQLTISIDDTPKGGTLNIDWGANRASIPFTVG